MNQINLRDWNWIIKQRIENADTINTTRKLTQQTNARARARTHMYKTQTETCAGIRMQ